MYNSTLRSYGYYNDRGQNYCNSEDGGQKSSGKISGLKDSQEFHFLLYDYFIF